jgi:hypothetical protein
MSRHLHQIGYFGTADSDYGDKSLFLNFATATLIIYCHGACGVSVQHKKSTYHCRPTCLAGWHETDGLHGVL